MGAIWAKTGIDHWELGLDGPGRVEWESMELVFKS